MTQFENLTEFNFRYSGRFFSIKICYWSSNLRLYSMYFLYWSPNFPLKTVIVLVWNNNQKSEHWKMQLWIHSQCALDVVFITLAITTQVSFFGHNLNLFFVVCNYAINGLPSSSYSHFFILWIESLFCLVAGIVKLLLVRFVFAELEAHSPNDFFYTNANDKELRLVSGCMHRGFAL